MMATPYQLYLAEATGLSADYRIVQKNVKKHIFVQSLMRLPLHGPDIVRIFTE